MIKALLLFTILFGYLTSCGYHHKAPKVADKKLAYTPKGWRPADGVYVVADSIFLQEPEILNPMFNSGELKSFELLAADLRNDKESPAIEPLGPSLPNNYHSVVRITNGHTNELIKFSKNGDLIWPYHFERNKKAHVLWLKSILASRLES